jgi:leader peptidase (prepilin peptidase)/N-methyltransferase
MTLIVSLPLGGLFAAWAERLIVTDRRIMSRPQATSRESWGRMAAFTVIYAACAAGLFVSVSSGWQATDEVQPSAWGLFLRRSYHQLLIGLILVATVVDWDGYVVPDQITNWGTLIGVLGAFLGSEMQLVHLWVDWSVAVPQLRGPYFPAWFDAHRHWHGLSWSVAGLIVGAGLTWKVRLVSSRLLGRETLGFGDVTFMAMIGSFLGWQPTVCAFLMAPLLGLCVGIPLKLLTNKPYIPYAPFLGAGALIVLYAWGPIWYRTRGIFGDWYGLLILAGMAGIGFVLLLGLLMAYRSIPVRVEGGER